MKFVDKLSEETLLRQALETAKRMLQEGSDIAYVSKVTNLPYDQVQALTRKRRRWPIS